MDPVLSFFSTLILLTAGIIVLFMWIAIITVIIIEGYDGIKERFNPTNNEEEDPS